MDGEDERPVGPPPAEDPFAAASAYEPEPVHSRASRARITAWIVVLIVLLAGGGAALVLRATNAEQGVDKLIPDDVAAYVKISLKPSTQQQAALRSLIGRYPSDLRDSFGTKIDDLLDGAFKDLGLSYRTDVKPWIGGQLAIVVRSPGGTTSDAPNSEPSVIGVVPIKDASSAKKALDRAHAKDPTFVFQIAGAVVYLGDTTDKITEFRNAVKVGHTLADNATYQREHASAGGDGLVFTYVDFSKLVGFAKALPGDILGSAGLAPGGGVLSASLRAESSGLVLSGHTQSAPSSKQKAGKPKLLESAPSDLLGSLTIFDIGNTLKTLLKALAQFGGLGSASPVSLSPQAFPNPQDIIKQFEQAVGVNLEKDLLPWLHGEFTIVVGSISQPPIPDIGIVIAPTDKAALARTMKALRSHLGQLLQGMGAGVSSLSDGFVVRIPDGPPIVARVGSDRVVIADSATYAATLLKASSSALGNDAVYRSAVDGSKPTVFQLFLRVDRVRAIAEGFAKLGDPDGYTTYERDVQPFLKPIQALGMQVTVNGKDVEFRLVLTIPK